MVGRRKALGLIIIKDNSIVDYNNILHEDSDGRIWLEKTREARLNPPCHIGKILWCMNCCIKILILTLQISDKSDDLTNIKLSIYKDDILIQEFDIDKELFCNIAKLPVCEIIIANNTYELPIINDLYSENELR